MFEFLSRSRDRVIVAVLLVFSLVQFLTSGHRGREPQLVDRAVLFVTSPLMKGLTTVFESTRTVAGDYLFLRDANERAQMCELNLSEAQRKSLTYAELKLENERLKAALNYGQSTMENEVLARVISTNVSTQYQSIKIDRGERDGVMSGMPVLSDRGVIGQVIRSVSRTADVLLVSDPASRIGAINQRTRVRGIIVGSQDGRHLQLEYVRREENITDGDIMVTAGSDGIFPSGVPVGVVKNVSRQTSGLFLSAEIVLFTDLSKVEEVMVVPVLFSGSTASVAP
jgi:rod shape-determining protein MreC